MRAGRHLPQRQGRHRRRRLVQHPAGGQPEGAAVGGRPALHDHRLRGDARSSTTTTLQLVLKTPYAILDSLLAEYTLGIIPAASSTSPTRSAPAPSPTSRSSPARPAPSPSTPTTGATRPSSTSCRSRTSPTTTPRSTPSRPARSRPSTTCPTTWSTRSRVPAAARWSPRRGAWVPFTMRVDQAPFNDVKVRQAMRLIVDRQADDRPDAQRLRLARQRHVRPARRGLRQRPAPARAGHRPGQVAAGRGRPGGAAGRALHRRRHRLGRRRPRPTSSPSRPRRPASRSRSPRRPRSTTTSTCPTPFAQDFWNTRNYIPQAVVGTFPPDQGGTYNETHWDNSRAPRPGQRRRPRSSTRPSGPTCSTRPRRSSTTRAA